jgi:hypothetical protein
MKNAVNQLFLTGGHACFPVYASSIVLGPGERHEANPPGDGTWACRQRGRAGQRHRLTRRGGSIIRRPRSARVCDFRDAHAAGLHVGIRHPPGSAGLGVDARSMNRLDCRIHARSDKLLNCQVTSFDAATHSRVPPLRSAMTVPRRRISRSWRRRSHPLLDRPDPR